MIQAPDFKEKQILVLNSYELKELKLKLNNFNLLLEFGDGRKEKVNLRSLIAVYIIGEATITSSLLRKLSQNGASIFLLKQNLQMYTCFNAYAEGNILIRRIQYSLNEEYELNISKYLVKNKVINQITLLKNKNSNFNINKKVIINKIKNVKTRQELLGLEGNMSKIFFKNYFNEINWYKRMPRTKVDQNNLLLDIGYTYLFNFVDVVLKTYGMDTYKGVYHQIFYQRKSLACDLMEPFRCIIDKTLLKMRNLNQYDENDFKFVKGGYLLSYNNSTKYTKIFLKELLRYKMDIYHYIRNYYYSILNGDELSETNMFKIK